ncbi:S1 family peptidase [Psychromicrobium lacuslunae]|uniref:S1 family peptidase n=1 Tax=Psychromicrobium lacuslunae TaxID=1618207 RepID=UPI0012FE8462|nr:trypsin-like serine protease [Psychromicrobium lacuslunae]
MKNTPRLIAVRLLSVLALLFVAGAFSAPAANAALGIAPSPRIIGGQQNNNPWVIQLGNITERTATGVRLSLCTGEALNDHWVLTAKHCVAAVGGGTAAAADLFSVRVNGVATNSTADRQNSRNWVYADRVQTWADGDLALIHFAASTGLANYPTIAAAYDPTENDAGVVQGYGLRSECNQTQADWLYRANISVLGVSADAEGADAVHVQGVNGIANHGDSGGPLTLGNNNQIVGVASTIDGVNCPSNIHGGANYTNVTLAAPSAWIANTIRG